MVVCTLTSHAIGAKHQERVRSFNAFVSLFFERNQASVSSALSCPAKQSNASGRVDTMMNAVAVSHAEIHWVIKVVNSRFSYHSCINLNSLLASMFPDSQIVKSLQMSKNISFQWKFEPVSPRWAVRCSDQFLGQRNYPGSNMLFWFMIFQTAKCW